MDNEALPSGITKSRRRYTPAFKERVLAECLQPGESVAGVAVRHGLNPNLVQKWRKGQQQIAQESFLRLPPPPATATPLSVPSEAPTTIRMEVPTPRGQLVVHWPVSQLTESITWLRALTR
jgi:transposase-like protein